MSQKRLSMRKIRELLRLKYLTAHPNGYRYSRFCERYRVWWGRIDMVMRQVYRRARRRSWTTRAPKFEVVDRETGEVQGAMVFVGVLGASNHTLAALLRGAGGGGRWVGGWRTGAWDSPHSSDSWSRTFSTASIKQLSQKGKSGFRSWSHFMQRPSLSHLFPH